MTATRSSSARLAAARRGRGAPERRTTARARGVSRRRDLLVGASAPVRAGETFEAGEWEDDWDPADEQWDQSSAAVWDDDELDEDDELTDEGVPRRGRLALVVVGVVVLAVAVAAAALVVSGWPHRGHSTTPAARTPGPVAYVVPPTTVPVATSLVRTTVGTSGDVAVGTWIHTQRPITRLSFAALTVPGVSALKPANVVVRPDPATGSSGTPVRYSANVWLLPGGATEVYVAYDLPGVVQRDSSVAGRALVRATSLDIRVDQPLTSSTRQVAGGRILAMACSAPSPDAGTLPCGRPIGSGAWAVQLPGASQHDVVMAQLDLSGSS